MKFHEDEPLGSPSFSQRMTSPAELDCLLSIGAQHFGGVLVEQWNTGLLVVIHGNPQFWVEDVGVLHTSDAEIAVRVTNIVNVETDEDDPAADAPVFRIGLARLEPLDVMPESRPSPSPAKKSPVKRRALLSRDRVRMSAGVLIAALLIATPLVLVAIAWRTHAQRATTADPQDPVPAAEEARLPALPEKTPLERNVAAGPETLSHLSPSGRTPAGPPLPQLTAETLRLPGIEPFLAPAVARRLELTPAQEGIFEGLNSTTQGALEDLEKYWESDSRLELAQRRDAVLEAARQQALKVLTDKQRQEWEALTR